MTEYVAWVCTNRAIARGAEDADPKRKRPVQVPNHKVLRESYIGPDGTLLPLSEAALANAMGVGCIVVTKDLFLIAADQTPSNSEWPDTIVPAGTGSLDWTAVCNPKRGATDLFDLLLREGRREFEEEAGLDNQRADKLLPAMRGQVLGHARVATRGGDPVFYILLLLDAAWGDVNQARASQIRPGEKTFSRPPHAFKIPQGEESLAAAIAILRERLFQREMENPPMSASLDAGLQMFSMALEESNGATDLISSIDFIYRGHARSGRSSRVADAAKTPRARTLPPRLGSAGKTS
jgi:hypothetical protein